MVARTHTAPPPTLALDPLGIPRELVARSQWVGWRGEWGVDKQGAPKLNKIPINPTTGAKASATDPATWTGFDRALAGMQRFGLNGLGYVFDATDPYIGVDLDRARDAATGQITPAAAALVDRLGTYTEVSVTGTGIHLIAACDTFPSGGNRRGGVETYWTERFFAFTGRPLPGRDRIVNRTADYLAWHTETFPPPPPPAPPATRPALNLSDAAVLERARRSPRFCRLYDGGNLGDYGNDHSAADLGELDHLIRAGADGPAQLDRLHRAGPLMRPKWDSRRGDQTYGERTIARALDGSVRPPAIPITPPAVGVRNPAKASAGPDPCAGVRDDVAALRAEVAHLTAENDRVRLELAEAKRTLSVVVQTATNRNLGDSGGAAAVLIAADVGRQAAIAPTGDGFYNVNPRRVADRWKDATGGGADRAGIIGESTVRRYVRKFADAGVFEVEYRADVITTQVVDRRTGELVDKEVPITVPWMRCAGSLADQLARSATYRDESRPNRGGARPRTKLAVLPTICPDCGGPIEAACRTCGSIAAPVEVEVTDEERALLEPVPTAELGADPSHGQLDRSRNVLPHEGVAQTSCGQVDRATGGRVERAGARADLLARRRRDLVEPPWLVEAPPPDIAPAFLPGFDPSPLDYLTDGTIGRRP